MSTIAFIGLGTMGGPMARNVIKAGHTVAVYDAAPAALDTFRDTNAKRAASPRDAADGASVVITCLPTSACCSAWNIDPLLGVIGVQN